MKNDTLYIQGMHGLGDNLHQRAVIRQLMKLYPNLVLETSWGSLYHDMIGPNLKLVRKASGLRTQTKNAARESEYFSSLTKAPSWPSYRIAYSGANVRMTKSRTVLEAMCVATGTDYATADYSLPIPNQWLGELTKALSKTGTKPPTKPLLVYRPLTARPEWRGSQMRNADPEVYARLMQRLRDSFFIVSVADLEDGKEWIVGPRLHADIELHRGELSFEALAALYKSADMVITSSGFSAILAPAVGTPCVSLIGGYETTGCHDSGKRFAPFLALGPDQDCTCWTSQCPNICTKATTYSRIEESVLDFMSENRIQISDKTTPFGDLFTSPDRKPATIFADPRLRQMRGRA